MNKNSVHASSAGPSEQSILGSRWKLFVVLMSILLLAYSLVMVVNNIPDRGPHPFDGFVNADHRDAWPDAEKVVLSSPSPTLRAMAARHIRLNHGVTTIPELRQVLVDGSTIAQVAALEIIGDLSLTPLIDAVAACAASPDPNVRAQAIWALGNMGTEAVPILLNLVKEDSARMSVALAFERMGAVAFDTLQQRDQFTNSSGSGVNNALLETARSWAEKGRQCTWSTTSNGLTMRLEPGEISLKPGESAIVRVEFVNVGAEAMTLSGYEGGGFSIYPELHRMAGEKAVRVILEDPADYTPPISGTRHFHQSIVSLESGQRAELGEMSLVLDQREYWLVPSATGTDDDVERILDEWQNGTLDFERRFGLTLATVEPWLSLPFEYSNSWQADSQRLTMSFTFGEGRLRQFLSEVDDNATDDAWLGLITIDGLRIRID